MTTADGKGEITAINLLKRTVRVRIKGGVFGVYNADDVKSGAVKETLKKWIK